MSRYRTFVLDSNVPDIEQQLIDNIDYYYERISHVVSIGDGRILVITER